MVRRRFVASGAVLAAAMLATVLVLMDSGAEPPRVPELDRLSRVLRAFEDDIVPRGAGSYVPPTSAEARTLVAAWRALQAGDARDATRLAEPIGVGVARTEDDWLLLRDELPGRGWGLHAVRPGSPGRVVVEVVHPVADIRTLDLGAIMAEDGAVRALLVAGAHRDALADGRADVARTASSPLHLLHRAAVGRGDVALQPHGFDESSYPEEFGDVVISSGADRPEAHIVDMARGMRADGFRVCVASAARCTALAARRNLQGRETRAVGGRFVHVEVTQDRRRTSTGRRGIAGAVMRALR